MITFYLIRHGAKKQVQFDPELTDIGEKQADLTGKHLKDISFSQIIASPKVRTKQTAELINNHLNTKLSFDERLLERMEWENESFEDFLREWDKTDLNRDFMPSHGTSSNLKGKAIKSVLDDIVKKYSTGNFLLVSHGGAIGDLLRNLFSEKEVAHAINPLSQASYVEIQECALTVISHNGKEYALRSVNNYSHLPQPVL